ncbi:MAG: hypothetical protein Q8K87_15675 [Hydrogenophaga sp.]|jgi:hypothetical protein|uniref:hypothetical protein n=1 Tax=Hydrogenophaga sp. TaxID=1904254 RepID=UPI00271B38E0|nr:hypothetical protein [Hydrogenophaga sp.]MDO9200983.1 hypothetical protein [Hydrogenophaga sp.]MDO9571210.1 hypothetical protein [Hydrogenophaga sp.]MDP1895558.1 hypothetical protein [Hydrogenophaga sp.]MDP3375879.1 hypothetical protein [Hydrogenophaga sp.]
MMQNKVFWSALMAEIQAGLALWADPGAYGAWIALGAHATAAGLFALAAWRLAPMSYRQPKLLVLAMLASTGFFIPLGGLFMALALWVAHRHPKVLETKVGQPIRPFEFVALDGSGQSLSMLRLRDARRALSGHQLSVDERLRLLLAMQHVSPRAVVPLLQDLLGDPVEDIRLLAYSMLDNWEKTSSEGIMRAQKAFEHAKNSNDKMAAARALMNLVDLLWWQIDAGLVRGDLRRMALVRCKDRCEKLLKEQPQLTQVWRVYVQVLVEEGSFNAAHRAVYLAERARMPQNSLLQLKAIVAHAQGDWVRLRIVCRRFDAPRSLPSRWHAVVAFWSRRHPLATDILLP